MDLCLHKILELLEDLEEVRKSTFRESLLSAAKEVESMDKAMARQKEWNNPCIWIWREGCGGEISLKLLKHFMKPYEFGH